MVKTHLGLYYDNVGNWILGLVAIGAPKIGVACRIIHVPPDNMLNYILGLRMPSGRRGAVRPD